MKIISSLVTDSAFMVGRALGAVLAGVEETIIKAHSRRGILDMTTGEVNAAAEAGTLTYRQTMQALELDAKAIALEKAARR